MLLNINDFDTEHLNKAFYLNKNEYEAYFTDNCDDDGSDDDDGNECGEDSNDQFDIDDDFGVREYKSLPFSNAIAKYVEEILDDKFMIDDLLFIFEMSRKRCISPCAIILSLIYLKRLRENSLSKCIKTFSSSELCLVSILLASKYLVDEGELNEIYNDEWANVVNMPVQRVNKLEKKILNELNWNLYVSPLEFRNFVDDIHLRTLTSKIQLQHGLCTYHELNYLLENMFFKKFTVDQLNLFSEIMLTCSITLLYALYTSLFTYVLMKSLFVTTNYNNNVAISDRNTLNNGKINHTNTSFATTYDNIENNLTSEEMVSINEINGGLVNGNMYYDNNNNVLMEINLKAVNLTCNNVIYNDNRNGDVPIIFNENNKSINYHRQYSMPVIHWLF